MTEGLKKGWTKVAFGDVVERVKETGIPNSAESRRYIGLEHMESESLTIYRWGSEVDLVVPKTLIKKGDVLFARRNTHLRRCAVAPFDTYFSPDGYAFRTKSPDLLQELLIYIVASDNFMNFAVEHSSGTHSKRVKWSDLVKYEFALPPIEEQKLIANLLNKINKCVQAYQELSIGIKLILNTYIRTSIIGKQVGDLVYDDRFGYHTKCFKLCAIGELIEKAQYGLSLPSDNRGNYPMIRMMDLSDGYVSGANLCSVNISEKDFINYRLDKGDILFNRTNSHELVGRTGIYYLDGEHVFASYLVRLKTNDIKLLPDYLTIYLNSAIGRQQLMKYASKGVSQTNINASNLKKTIMPIPNIEYQKKVIKQVQTIRLMLLLIQKRVAELTKMMRDCANHMEVAK